MAKAAVAKKKDWTITQNNIEDKEKALKTALAGIDKKFGTMAVMRLGECKNMNIESIPTGLFTLDLALGIGGLPKGRIAEIYGPESSGKTTVALLNIAEAQKRGGICAFIDAEHALDPEYAKRLGVDLDNLYISQPDNGEQALEIAEQLASSGAIDTLVVDSVAALVPKAEIDGEMGESHVGLQARLMSQGLRKLASIISRSQTVFIFINQLREKINNNYGPSETTTGGRALKFYASVRLDIRKQSAIKGGKEGKEILGYHTSIKVVKNKVAPPFKATTIDMIPGTGFDNIGAIVNLAIKRDIIQKSGSWYTYQKNKAQGIPGIRQFFVDHPEQLEAIKEELSKQPYNNEEMPPKDESIKKEKSPYDVSNIEKPDNDDALIGNSEDDYFDFDDLMVIKPDQTE